MLLLRMMTLSFLPRWLAWSILILGLPTVLGGAVLVPVVCILGAVVASSSGQFEYQCDSAIGPDPSVTETISFGANDMVDATDAPTTNPYAGMTTEAGDTAWQDSCVTAMNTAPFQLRPLQTSNAGAAAQCARTLALAAAADSGDMPTLARQILYGASLAAGDGRCVLPSGQLPGQAQCQQGVGPAALPSAAALVLPNSIAGQAGCGQRVDPAAISAGDLVFWNYVDNAPANEGLAVGGNQMLTDANGKYLLAVIPAGNGVRVKRYLASG
jgi:hypothetical protein